MKKNKATDKSGMIAEYLKALSNMSVKRSRVYEWNFEWE